MKNLLLLVFVSINFITNAQYDYEPSKENPFGKLNPKAPKQTADFAPMIGECDCKSTTRKQDGTWNEPIDMVWKFKYIMNGMAVQDETTKSDGKHSGSIRQYSKDSTRWYVHYYASASVSTELRVWEGNKNKDGNIVLYRNSPAPNGTEGDYRLTFSNITNKGFDWVGEWVNKTETIVYPTWRISCVRRDVFRSARCWRRF